MTSLRRRGVVKTNVLRIPKLVFLFGSLLLPCTGVDISSRNIVDPMIEP